jgi:hypothetical protein
VLASSIVTTVKLALLAEGAADLPVRQWPDSVDAAALAMYAGVAFGLPAVGYWLMALDIRRYLRSLRRALVVVARAATPLTPYWARRDDPPCLVALDLQMPCTEEEVLAAYRKRVKDLHPDRGGDLQAFLQLQRHFEQALLLARSGKPKA